MNDATTAGWRRVEGPAGILGVYEVGPIQRAVPTGVLVVCHDAPSDVEEAAPPTGEPEPAAKVPGVEPEGARGTAAAAPDEPEGLDDAEGPEGPDGLEGFHRDASEAGGVPGGGDVIGASAAGLSDVVSAFCDRLSSGSPDWRVVGACLRGVPPSEGRLFLAGWEDDLAAVVEAVTGDAPGTGVWLCGLGVGGTLALEVAVRDQRVRGVAVLGAPSSLARFAAGPLPDLSGFGDRPLLVLHGSEDHVVPTGDARAIVAADGAGAEVRFLHGAGHLLQADPRAVALLLGWLERQRP